MKKFHIQSLKEPFHVPVTDSATHCCCGFGVKYVQAVANMSGGHVAEGKWVRIVERRHRKAEVDLHDDLVDSRQPVVIAVGS